MKESLDSSKRGSDWPENGPGRSVSYGQSGHTGRRIERRRPESRAMFLADMSRTLFDSLDAEETLINVATMAMPELGAWCVVDIFNDDESVRRLKVIHPNPAFAELTVELETRYAPLKNDFLGANRILRTQQPELVPEITGDLFDAKLDKRYIEILKTLGLSSVMIVPLKARGRLLGAMTFSTIDRDQIYTPKDLLFAEDLAGRAAMAVDNGRLYQIAERAREEAVAAVARATLADRAKTDFLATMSHELRTPLNAIAGYAELLELGMRGPVTDQQKEAILRIRRSQQHLLGIVNDILMFSKTETGRIPMNFESIEVLPAVEAVQFLVEPMLAANDIQFAVSECEEGTSVNADSDRFQQILVNMISNAAKFSSRGGSVTLLCRKRDHLVQIEVIDEGSGIEGDKLEAIFEPFVQLSTGLTRTADGSGLGLAISRELSRMMGGDVSVKSVVGKGSTFSLTLPMSTPSVPVL